MSTYIFNISIKECLYAPEGTESGEFTCFTSYVTRYIIA